MQLHQLPARSLLPRQALTPGSSKDRRQGPLETAARDHQELPLQGAVSRSYRLTSVLGDGSSHHEPPSHWPRCLGA